MINFMGINNKGFNSFIDMKSNPTKLSTRRDDYLNTDSSGPTLRTRKKSQRNSPNQPNTHTSSSVNMNGLIDQDNSIMDQNQLLTGTNLNIFLQGSGKKINEPK
jgi:hypothetical protein